MTKSNPDKPKKETKKSKKKGLLDSSSSDTLVSNTPIPADDMKEPEAEKPVLDEPEKPLDVPAPPAATPSPEPNAEDQMETMVGGKPKYSRKVGAGGKTGEFDDEPFDVDLTTRSPLKMQSWMNGRLALSKRSSRFELPIDMRLLETMTPLQYLGRYCVVTSKRQMLYDKIYMKHKSGYTGRLGLQDLRKALADVLIHSIDDQKMKLLIEMLQIQEADQIDKKLFNGIAAFAERLLYPIFARGEQNADTQKEKIESADFYALKWKFHGVDVNQHIRQVLETL